MAQYDYMKGKTDEELVDMVQGADLDTPAAADVHLLEGADHLPHMMGDEALELIEEFVTGDRPDDINIDRTLASVLFTDIVGSTGTMT